MPRKARIDSIADEQSSPHGVAAVDRALTLLAAYRQGDCALSLSELAARTRLYPSTVSRLLSSLMHARLIERLEDGRYGLGLEVMRLYSVFSASFSMGRVVMPALTLLVEQSGESAAFHVAHGDHRLCLYRVDSPHPVRDHTRAGELLPLHQGSGGRVLTAYAETMPADTSAEDQALYEQIRQRGYFGAINDRLNGVAGISAPVFKSDGSLAGAVTLTMPSDRYDDRYIPMVRAAAEGLSKQIP
ncbi:Pectin degradation repressor protein KdgR [Pigmentiphaga humi]|uniref:Pectin degradation repressor protein KdgR n=1 Tax=Pigmentiphaga humi TaxID=2478468 RepID=A0A3P4AZ86_9BURK|nr:IclR family transcriptional regulator [Pigmentiphaga humi]VCU69394.1 Pectin degradation repressor protein KdgR [Pigmentiphaga humi]